MIDYDVLPAPYASGRRSHLCVVPGPVGASRFSGGESRDAALLAAVAYRRDESAFEDLYRMHAAAVGSAALRICRDPGTAEDIVTRTFMKLWDRASRLAAKPVRLRPWLVTVARNAAIDYVRAAAVCVSFDDALADAAPAVCPEDEAVTNALMDALLPALARLAPAQRAVIELRYFEDRSFADIAARLGEPLETVKSRARLALAQLRRSLT